VDKFVPTEEQWEWAARGGEAANTWAWGDDPPVSDDDRLCWFFGRDDQTFPDRPSGSCPVGFYDQKVTHPFGLEDMTGNVWTWTTSEGDTAEHRVVRGGGWDNTDPDRMRTGFRNDVIPADIRDQHLGFRCAQAPL
jgi:formylglycine-generating enzyme required for sulfatase activity